MNVKIHYDEQTKGILKEFKRVLKEYEKQLHSYVDKKTWNWTCSRDIEDEFWNSSIQNIRSGEEKPKLENHDTGREKRQASHRYYRPLQCQATQTVPPGSLYPVLSHA